MPRAGRSVPTTFVALLSRRADRLSFITKTPWACSRAENMTRLNCYSVTFRDRYIGWKCWLLWLANTVCRGDVYETVNL